MKYVAPSKGVNKTLHGFKRKKLRGSGRLGGLCFACSKLLLTSPSHFLIWPLPFCTWLAGGTLPLCFGLYNKLDPLGENLKGCSNYLFTLTDQSRTSISNFIYKYFFFVVFDSLIHLYVYHYMHENNSRVIPPHLAL